MSELSIASWNVNSLKVRLQQVLDWLQTHPVDILALQETKTRDELFPLEAICAAGYHVVYSGQKTYNGVAILSKTPIDMPVITDFPTLNDPARRVLITSIGDLLIANLYVPNGSEVGSEKYHYKLDWLQHLHDWVAKTCQTQQKMILLGDFNIAPHDADVHDPQQWKEAILVSPQERAALQGILDLGFFDTFRHFEQTERLFSWWDYRQMAYRRNRGLRIDLILASQTLKAHCQASYIDKTPRGWERPSDHAPVVATFKIDA